jgi:hypothetical protein
MAMSRRREPHSMASAAASGTFRRATASSSAGLGFQPCGIPNVRIKRHKAVARPAAIEIT